MATTVVAMSLYPGVGEGVVAVENPIGIESAKGPLTAALVIGIGTLFASIRRRRSDGASSGAPSAKSVSS